MNAACPQQQGALRAPFFFALHQWFFAAALFAIPFAAGAQQPRSGVALIGVLTLGVAPSSRFVEALRLGLREQGHVEGHDIAFEYRFAEGRLDRLSALAAELVDAKADLIVTESTQAALSAKRATQSIPIVMATVGADPVKAGLVASLNRPGGNVTGLLLFAGQLDMKRLQILRDTAIERKRVAVLYNAASPNAPERVANLTAAGKALGLELLFVEVRSPADFDKAFKAAEQSRPSALITISDGMLLGQRARIVEFATKNRLPGVFPERQFADAGGLMAYGVNIEANFRRAATYVHKILRGARPADLPVEEPAKLDFVINLKTAKALGLMVPPALLVRADEVIR